MLDVSNDHIDTWVEVNSLASLPKDESMAVARSAIDALRVHGDGGVERNLKAGAAIAALRAANLPRGEFGRFCTEDLQISSTYRARLLRLHELRGDVPGALDWAKTQKHGLAECQSAQNLIRLVNDWLKRDEPPKTKTISKRQGVRPSQDDAIESESAIQDGANLISEREKTIFELKSELANRDDAISDLRRRLAE